ncbi:type II toxin-antitoxin system Phd/YefM family antitoxin [Methylopila sp. Yamaguchi]|uniref:type II toxin-antitoxin system Phd/YefM family antitoxin n=1 Tax=Methylopila sp. Yamaguchi TaxID=1437817 RepID=UPI000CB24B58|nr:type II toxin-antitoxin system prevent-host-death family antitoxin [Methylopila sp. Yamaguchi]GBD49490.1 antitoxin yefM [Methylopila sp. Yamaguchi]
MPSHVGFTEFRQNLATHLDDVVDSRAPLLVTRKGGRSVVVISEEEWRGMEETLYLMSNPRNAEHLLKGIAELDAGKGVERDLIER